MAGGLCGWSEGVNTSGRRRPVIGSRQGHSRAGFLDRQPTQESIVAPLTGRDRQLAFLGFNFVLDLAGDGIPGLRPLESLLVMAVNQANIAPLTRDPEVRARTG